MAMPRSSLSCTAGLHEFGKSILPSRSADCAVPAVASASAINDTARRMRIFTVRPPVGMPSPRAITLEGVGIDGGAQPGRIRERDDAGLEPDRLDDDVAGHLERADGLAAVDDRVVHGRHGGLG